MVPNKTPKNPKGAGRKPSRWPKGMNNRKSINVPREIAEDVGKIAEILAWNNSKEDRIKAILEWLEAQPEPNKALPK